MRAFAELYRTLDETTKTTEKVAALATYFSSVQPADAAWAIYFLIGRRPKQVVPSRRLAAWAASASGIPEWLYEECQDAVGDVAEVIALLLPEGEASTDVPLHVWVEERLLPLRNAPEDQQREQLLAAWREMSYRQRLVWNKLIMGSFRVGVSRQLIVRALAQVSGADAATISHRLMGDWEPRREFFAGLMSGDRADADVSRPYPFFLAYPLETEPEILGDVHLWQAEWKWDGIRGQLIHRKGQTFLWSRGEELVTDRYPEITALGAYLADGTVVDGEILPWRDERPLPFAQLQRRIGRKTLTKKILSEVPIVFMAYDLIENQGTDVRDRELQWRRSQLEALVASVPANHALKLSPVLHPASWAELKSARENGRDRFVEGLMLKRLASPYRVGRQRGDWWKWKVNPYTIDAVLIYAQPGHGKRASLFTDYTFGVWDQNRLVPIAKAYSGLTDEEIRQVDAFIRRNTVEKHGPVRSVAPELVFELAFEGIQASSRHKSGVAVRFPRILRWRVDKKREEADTLDALRRMLPK